ncbi:50S ribosomal protein L13 [candidate division TA06 bacterium]|uniref:Large ribosomal subunit protein uL13 n=1 Tax=candidate division TA06 bacterium TaxID=2250710 RepID=A0A933MII0_UNCT6|nr:50S ribosomal protein L13 [candidate division TA06 bacterium]
MKTYVAKKGELEQKWFLVDASGIPLGRLASKVAQVLRGKGKPQYTPNLDCGDHVVVVNAAKVRLTGSKLQNKTLKRHSGFQGGLRTDKYQDLMVKRPEKVIELAVKGMLPKTTLARSNFSKLHVYVGGEHPHIAQGPKAVTL